MYTQSLEILRGDGMCIFKLFQASDFFLFAVFELIISRLP